MKALVLLVVLLGLALAVYIIARAVLTHHAEKLHWEMRVEKTSTGSKFYLIRGYQKTLVGVARRSSTSYSDDYIKLQSKTEDLMYEWNATERSV